MKYYKEFDETSKHPLVSFVQKTLGSWLRQYLDAAKLSQRQLADLVGREEAFISMVLNGDRKPKKGDIRRWATALGLNEDQRAEFMELAGLAHCPEWIVSEYLSMKRKLGKPS